MNEQQYKFKWIEQAANADSTYDMSVIGGRLASNLSQVFSAGYQGALRHVFPEIRYQGWSALAVSEDRSEENPLPGLTAHIAEHGYRLKGHKTWVAACDVLDSMIVRARLENDIEATGDGRSESTSQLFHIALPTKGLTLTSNPNPSLLPDLSQGRAHFDDVAAAESTVVDSAGLKNFAPCEAMHILTAFVAWVAAQAPSLGSEATPLLDQARRLLNEESLPEQAQRNEFSAAVQGLATQFGSACDSEAVNFQRDRRLIAMYAPR